MLPALASIVLAYILMSIGFSRIPESVGAITGSQSWLDSWAFDTNFFAALKAGTVDIFITQGSPFNNVLWTMFTEFWGSFLIFAFLMLFASSKHRWAVYVALAIFTFNTWFLAFILGVILADAYTHGKLENLKRMRFIVPLLIGGLFFGGMPHRKGESEGTIYQYFLQPDITNINYSIAYLTLGAAMIILAILLSKRIRGWLSHPRIAILGKYTFSLYLTHLFVLYTFTCSLFLMLHDLIGYNKTVCLVTFLSLPPIVITAWLFERYIDAPSIKFSKYVGMMYRSEKKVNWSAHKRAIMKRVRRLI